MLNETRKKFIAFQERIASLNGVPSADTKFTVAPSVQQTVETKIQESSDFLRTINIVPVQELTGELLGMGVDGPLASRTDTTQADRATRDPQALDSRTYTCKQTNSDWHRRYAVIDMWAKFPDFETRLRNAIIEREALDRMLIGFRGVSAAATTNLGANPLLQDVNIGWLQHLRLEAPQRVLSDGPSTGANAVKVGAAGADYRSLDSLVYDAVQLLDPIYREDPGLRVYVGRELLHDKYFSLLDSALNADAVNTLAVNALLAEKKLGGIQAATAPYMIPNGVFITNPSNLSIYYQDGKRRRMVIDNPKRDRIENFSSSNDAYVIEELGAAALVENIVQV
ncbi:MAG: Ralstonia virus [Pseudomonadota bacterium]|jgi:P2 family phage major capsid protein